jgi:hypothetical protein
VLPTNEEFAICAATQTALHLRRAQTNVRRLVGDANLKANAWLSQVYVFGWQCVSGIER